MLLPVVKSSEQELRAADFCKAWGFGCLICQEKNVNNDNYQDERDIGWLLGPAHSSFIDYYEVLESQVEAGELISVWECEAGLSNIKKLCLKTIMQINITELGV